MRLSELMGDEVVDEAGERVGRVLDVRVRIEIRGSWEVVGLVVGEGGLRSAAAHQWGFAQGRAGGPGLLRRMLAGPAEAARFVPAGRVSDWGPEPIRLDGSANDLSPAMARRLR